MGARSDRKPAHKRLGRLHSAFSSWLARRAFPTERCIPDSRTQYGCDCIALDDDGWQTVHHAANASKVVQHAADVQPAKEASYMDAEAG
jgi:hypothetical protein